MKSIINTLSQSPAFKACFKTVAIVKYLFFPFLMANSQGVVNALPAQIQEVVAKAETPQATWVATANGIWKINKATQRMQHITAENSVLPSNNVTGICATPSGNIYATTDKGIFRFDGYAFLALNDENSQLPAAHFTSIACDSHNNLWIGTQGKGLILMNGYRTRTFNTGSPVQQVAITETGEVVVTLLNSDRLTVTNEGLPLTTNELENEYELATKN